MTQHFQIIGNYRLVEELAEGTFGQVYRAEHRYSTERIVAIKLLHTLVNTEKERENFVHEVCTLELLTHPSILPILDFGIQEGTPYLITEFVSGGSLRDRLKHVDTRPISLDESLHILRQVSQALHAAHQQQVTHCNLKPENILFHTNGNILLTDFGLPIMLDNTSIRSTDSVDTPSYITPEQFQDHAIKESDQYALGCIAYELLTGNKPFTTSDVPSMEIKDITEAPSPLHEQTRTISLEVERVIMTALAKDPKDRFEDVQEFVQAFEQAVTTLLQRKIQEKQVTFKPSPDTGQPTPPGTASKNIPPPPPPYYVPASDLSQYAPPLPYFPTAYGAPPLPYPPTAYGDTLKDFFISYTRADLSWAKWIKWQLDKAGYTTVLRPWSIRSDANLEIEIREASAHTKRTILVLSPNYIGTFKTKKTFITILKQKTAEEIDKLLPICIQACGNEFRKLLASINYVDLSEEDEITAGAMLLAAIDGKSIELTIQPVFPGETGNTAPTFPGMGHISPSAKSQFEPSPTPPILPTKSLEVFFSYSHRDAAMRRELEEHLSNLKRQYSFSGWHDGEIGAGNEWAKEIDAHLSRANVVLLLISKNFFASNYCYNIEMMRSLERHEKGEAHVIPIILRPTHWEVTHLGKLQALPTGSKAITLWSNRDAAFVNVARGIQKVVDKLTGNDSSG